MKPKVLVFGEDDTLLAVRSAVLRSRGLLVAGTTSLDHVMSVAEQFDAVVVCTSASFVSREQLQHLARETPQTSVVFLNQTDMNDPEKWQRQVEVAAHKTSSTS